MLLQSAWMMKYYIMDLSPHNSMVKYLVDHGHTVFMISWLNPGAEDRDLGMEDYRRLGTMAAIDAIGEILPGRKIHGVGYCLGGILLTIAAAAMARDGDDRLASVTLFTTMTDFTEVGEMEVFMDPGEVAFIEDMMWEKGYLDPKQAGGAFQLIEIARPDLVEDGARVFPRPARADVRPDGLERRWHPDAVSAALGAAAPAVPGQRAVRGDATRSADRPVHISDIHVPIFAVAAERDHVAPWRSVYKLHLQSDATELTFVLTSGGHNVGIVNEPGHPRRSYQTTTCREGERALDAETWKASTPTARDRGGRPGSSGWQTIRRGWCRRLRSARRSGATRRCATRREPTSSSNDQRRPKVGKTALATWIRQNGH